MNPPAIGTLLWSYGDPWVDLTPHLQVGSVSAVTETLTMHLINLPNGWRQRHGVHQPLSDDGIPLELATAVGSSCGFAFTHPGGWHRTSRLLLAWALPQPGAAATNLEHAFNEARARWRADDGWRIDGHPDQACAARWCGHRRT